MGAVIVTIAAGPHTAKNGTSALCEYQQNPYSTGKGTIVNDFAYRENVNVILLNSGGGCE